MDPLIQAVTSSLEGEAASLWRAVLEHAVATEPGDDGVRLRFPRDDRALWIMAPGSASLPASLPAALPPRLSRLLGACGGLTFGDPGEADQLVLHDGRSGTLDAVGDDLWDERSTGAPAGEVLAPVDLGLSAFYFVHPSTGRLWLRDEVTLEVSDTSDPVVVFLRELACELRDASVDDAFAAARHRSEWLVSS